MLNAPTLEELFSNGLFQTNRRRTDLFDGLTADLG